jgi:purine-binding chemotaxis protein CheW
MTCWSILAFQGNVAGFAGVRLVVFRVADLVFAVESAVVKEILPKQNATRIPGADDAVEGLINVRGRMLTLVNARRALNYPASSGDGVIMLLDVGDQTAGLAVDDVLDLFSVAHDELEARDGLLGIDPALVRAVGRQAGVSFILLDIEALLGPILFV